MKKYVAANSQAEVTGSAISSISMNLMGDEMRPILAEHGIEQIQDDAWYSQQITLDVLKAAHKQLGDTLSMVAVGIQVIDSAELPPIEDFGEAIGAIAQIYAMNHRNVSDGEGFNVERVSEQHIQVTNATPYPDDLIYGYVYGLVQRYCPPNVSPTLSYQDPSKIDSDENTIVNVKW